MLLLVWVMLNMLKCVCSMQPKKCATLCVNPYVVSAYLIGVLCFYMLKALECFYMLSHGFICFHTFSNAFKRFHMLSYACIRFHTLPYAFKHFHTLSYASIRFHTLPYAFIMLWNALECFYMLLYMLYEL